MANLRNSGVNFGDSWTRSAHVGLHGRLLKKGTLARHSLCNTDLILKPQGRPLDSSFRNARGVSTIVASSALDPMIHVFSSIS